MRKDIRPYRVKKLYLAYRAWYLRHFIEPAFDYLGPYPTFMNPRYIRVNGPNIRMGQCATVTGEKGQYVEIGVWGREPGEGEISIGDYVLISPGTRISASDKITIGNGVMIAHGVYITDSDWHGIYDRLERPPPSPVSIQDNAWLGDSCKILKGVTIGENSVVGAGAVVTQDVPANVIVAGNPAMVVKQLDPNKKIHTRGDFFANPEALFKWYDQIDLLVLKDNSYWRWLKALIWPSKQD